MTDDRETAREALHRETTWGAAMSGVDDAAARANELIDAFAHELAETIREEATGSYGGAYDGYMGAADLIDPEVQL